MRKQASGTALALRNVLSLGLAGAEGDSMETQIFDRELSMVDEGGGLIRKVEIRFGSPYIEKSYDYREDNVDWAIDFEVVGLVSPDSCLKHRAIQVDALGAFIQALKIVSEYLRLSEPYKQGRLFWLTPQDNCGLPIFVEPDYIS